MLKDARLNLVYPDIMNMSLDMPLNELINSLYMFIVSISGIAAFTMMVWGGLNWLTSRGNPIKVSNAKEKLTSAFLGLIIILTSYLILKLINPDLLTLSELNLF